jgi:hypothetical protein
LCEDCPFSSYPEWQCVTVQKIDDSHISVAKDRNWDE